MDFFDLLRCEDDQIAPVVRAGAVQRLPIIDEAGAALENRVRSFARLLARSRSCIPLATWMSNSYGPCIRH